MARYLFFFISCVLIVSCMTPLTKDGAAVRIVTELQKERACDSLGIVTASESMGHSTSGDAESAMNKARNKVSESGGNAMRIVSTSSDISATTIIAEALRCDYESVKEVIDIHIKGVDDGIKTTKQQDYREACLFAKREAVERAGVKIKSITTIYDLMINEDYIETKAEGVLLPGYRIIDIGYNTDGTYQVFLIGRLQVNKPVN